MDYCETLALVNPREFYLREFCRHWPARVRYIFCGLMNALHSRIAYSFGSPMVLIVDACIFTIVEMQNARLQRLIP